MGIRNCKDIGDNLQKIVTCLLQNDNLIKLLYYEDKDPLNNPNLTNEEKSKYIFHRLINIVPKVNLEDKVKSALSIRVVRTSNLSQNTEFKDVVFLIDTFVPLPQWLIKEDTLRPFAIMGEVINSLRDRKINGLGKIEGGDFELTMLTDEMSCYTQSFVITSYD